MVKNSIDPTPAEILEREGEGLGRFLYLLVPDPLDAEDLFQALFACLARRGTGGEAEPALYRSALALARKHIRNETRSFYRPVDVGSAPAALTRKKERLRRAWAEVPVGNRAAIALLVGYEWETDRVGRVLQAGAEKVFARTEKGLLLFQREIDGRERRAAIPRGWERGRVLASLFDREKEGEKDLGKVGGRIAVDLQTGIRNFHDLYRSILRVSDWKRMHRRAVRELPSPSAELLFDSIDTPLGVFQFASLEGAVVGTLFGRRSADEWVEKFGGSEISRAREGSKGLEIVGGQLREYFAGNRREFTFPYRLLYVSSFQASVLDECARIPYGAVRSYKQIADAAGRPGSMRAVGGALGRNPLPVVIPCHRVISHTGRLGGFSAGISRKEELLAMEGMADLFSGSPGTGHDHS